MSNLNKERREAIETALGANKIITHQQVIKDTLYLLDGKDKHPKGIPSSVYGLIRHYLKIGKLVKVIHSSPPAFTKNDFIEDRCEHEDVLKGLSGEEVIEVISTYIRNYEIKPEAVAKYQRKLSELSTEITTLKVTHTETMDRAKEKYKEMVSKLCKEIEDLKITHTQEILRMTTEHKKVADKLDRFMAAAAL